MQIFQENKSVEFKYSHLLEAIYKIILFKKKRSKFFYKKIYSGSDKLIVVFFCF